MKVYSSDSDSDVPAADDDQSEFEPDYATLFDAPNYGDFIKITPTLKSRNYERRVQSLMKAGMIAAISTQQWPDAATFIKYGPGFAKAAGNLAAEDARVAGLIDMITAPDSPYVVFGMVAIPLISQLVRNHQSDLKEAAHGFKAGRAARREAKAAGLKRQTVRPPITVHLFKREIKIPIRLRFRFNVKQLFTPFLASTVPPTLLSYEVFSDPTVIRALHKMGIFPRADGGQHVEEN